MDSHAYEIAELPDYRALLVVDMMNFSGEPGRDHARITEQIPLILEQTFLSRGLSHVWQAASFHGTTGDGYFAGFDTRYLPFLLATFVPALQAELEYQNRTRPGNQPMRMRVSLTVGPMTDTGTNAISDGSGNARIEAHRMIDDKSVKSLLTRSNSTTCVAAIISDRVYEDAVEPGFTAEDPSLYVPVDVDVKTYQGRAYLRVPTPSGGLLTQGFHRPMQDKVQPDHSDRSAEPDGSGTRYIGVQHAHGSVGDVISGHDNNVHTGSGNQINDPRNYGDGVTVFGTNQGGVQHRVDKGKDNQ